MDRSTLRALGLVSGLGFAITVPMGLFAWAGLWLDGQFGTRPLFMLVGILVGLIAAGASIAELLAFQSGRGGRVLRRRQSTVKADAEEG